MVTAFARFNARWYACIMTESARGPIQFSFTLPMQRRVGAVARSAHWALRPVLALIGVVVATARADACFVMPAPDRYESWAVGSTGHPLVGELLVAGTPYRKAFQAGECITPPATYLRSLVADERPDVVLLGEVHDNPIHHGYRSLWLNLPWQTPDGAHARPPPAVVFEHIRADQQEALDRFAALDDKAHHSKTAGELFRLLAWDKSGWPDQTMFEPLFAAAIASGLPILPGDPPKGRVRDVARSGADALVADDKTRMNLDEPLPPVLGDALARDIKDSHCGLLPDSAVPGMALAQRYRDAHLADAVLKAAERHGSATLLAGNGHVRIDHGVPWHIGKRAPGKKVVSVMLIEVEDGKTDLQAYVQRDGAGRPTADYILLTPRADRKDPCEEMRGAYGKK